MIEIYIHFEKDTLKVLDYKNTQNIKNVGNTCTKTRQKRHTKVFTAGLLSGASKSPKWSIVRHGQATWR